MYIVRLNANFYKLFTRKTCFFHRSVFVGNIPYEATEEKLKDIFSQAGSVGEFLQRFEALLDKLKIPTPHLPS